MPTRNKIKAPITRKQIERIVKDCLADLLERDITLLQDDVSERAITHKLAEYLQVRIPDLNVDCEYNRNYELGEHARKMLYVLGNERHQMTGSNLGEDDLLAVSTYPDIIVHRRRTNDKNLLVVEVKKENSQVDHGHDHRKLAAFTDTTGNNSYHYSYGVFILLHTGMNKTKRPQLKWFANGKAITRNSVARKKEL